MPLRQLFVAPALAMAAGSAFAFHCPAEMNKIDVALANNPKRSPEQLDEVKKLRAVGEAQHRAGKHQ